MSDSWSHEAWAAKTASQRTSDALNDPEITHNIVTVYCHTYGTTPGSKDDETTFHYCRMNTVKSDAIVPTKQTLSISSTVKRVSEVWTDVNSAKDKGYVSGKSEEKQERYLSMARLEPRSEDDSVYDSTALTTTKVSSKESEGGRIKISHN